MNLSVGELTCVLSVALSGATFQPIMTSEPLPRAAVSGVLDYSDAGFAASARFQQRSVILVVRCERFMIALVRTRRIVGCEREFCFGLAEAVVECDACWLVAVQN